MTHDHDHPPTPRTSSLSRNNEASPPPPPPRPMPCRCCCSNASFDDTTADIIVNCKWTWFLRVFRFLFHLGGRAGGRVFFDRAGGGDCPYGMESRAIHTQEYSCSGWDVQGGKGHWIHVLISDPHTSDHASWFDCQMKRTVVSLDP